MKSSKLIVVAAASSVVSSMGPAAVLKKMTVVNQAQAGQPDDAVAEQ